MIIVEPGIFDQIKHYREIKIDPEFMNDIRKRMMHVKFKFIRNDFYFEKDNCRNYYEIIIVNEGHDLVTIAAIIGSYKILERKWTHWIHVGKGLEEHFKQFKKIKSILYECGAIHYGVEDLRHCNGYEQKRSVPIQSIPDESEWNAVQMSPFYILQKKT